MVNLLLQASLQVEGCRLVEVSGLLLCAYCLHAGVAHEYAAAMGVAVAAWL
jgi:hypothetical protein